MSVSYEVSTEQEQLASAVRDVLGERSQPRLALDGGPPLDVALWKQLAQLGLVALSAPETVGGSGGSTMDQTLVAEELGRAAAAVPVMTSAVASHVLGALGGRQPSAILRALVQGDDVALVAMSATTGLALDVTAEEGDGGWCLRGTVNDLLEAASAQSLVVRAVTARGPWWFFLPMVGAGVEWWQQAALDPTQRLAGMRLDAAPAVSLGPSPLEHTLEDSALNLALVLLAAQATGAAGQALDMAVDYAKVRYAFGQPIGRFQAIKHRLSEMLVLTENARSATYNAGWSIDAGRHDAAVAARLAKAVATENAVRVVHDAIQTHGGIGFTWDHDLHLLLRRAKTCQLVLGSPDDHFESIAAALLDARMPDAVAPGASAL